MYSSQRFVPTSKHVQVQYQEVCLQNIEGENGSLLLMESFNIVLD